MLQRIQLEVGAEAVNQKRSGTHGLLPPDYGCRGEPRPSRGSYLLRSVNGGELDPKSSIALKPSPSRLGHRTRLEAGLLRTPTKAARSGAIWLKVSEAVQVIRVQLTLGMDVPQARRKGKKSTSPLR